jgi:hypothetical protein
MNYATLYRIITYLVALVWLINGLVCKVLNFVPRHHLIVARILGREYSSLITFTIGIAEITMAIWIITRIQPKLNAIVQILIIGTMNTLEFLLAPDLLLWKRFNAVFAFLFICLIFYNEFILKKKIQHQD